MHQLPECRVMTLAVAICLVSIRVANANLGDPAEAGVAPSSSQPHIQAPETTASRPSAKADTAPAEDPLAQPASDPIDVLGEISNMRSARGDYDALRSLLGREHVLVTAGVVARKICARRGLSALRCDLGAWSGGMATLVGVPLVGVGGGHGLDWYPVLHTERESHAFETFEAHARHFQRVLERLTRLEAPANHVRDLHTELLSMVERLTARPQQDDATFAQTASSLYQCVRHILRPTAEPMLTRAVGASALDDSRLITGCHRSFALLRGLAADAMPMRRLALAVDRVREYFSILDGAHLGEISRHNLLLVPTLGMSLSHAMSQGLMWGLLLELGWRHGLRLGVGGGFVAQHDKPLAPLSGAYLGISLSGEIADDLFHLVEGAVR